MATVDDVAAYILAKAGPMTTMKLQKLCYYAQAWHLAWEGKPLFPERIEAWRNGPVIPALYNAHRGQFTVADWPGGDADTLSGDERETIDEVLEGYGHLTPAQLSWLAHREEPWKAARQGLEPHERGGHEINLELTQEFYDAQANGAQANDAQANSA
jgi:uncharacterized phage-associated protein